MGLLTIEKDEILYVTKQQPQKANNYTVADFVEPKKSFLQSVVETVTMEEIFTWDQTGINIILSSSWTLEKKAQRGLCWLA